MPNGDIIQKDTYVEADEKTYRALTYDMFHAIIKKQDDYSEKLGGRVTKLENRGFCDKALTAGSGFVGGAAVMLFIQIKKVFGG